MFAQNTTDEDSMVVQHILCVRVGKRQAKPEPIPEVKIEPVEEKTEETDEVKSEVDDKEAETAVEKTVENPSKEIIKETEPDDDEKVETTEKDKSDEEEEEEVEKKESKDEEEEEAEEDVENKGESKTPAVEPPKVETSLVEAKPQQMVDVDEYYVKYRNFSYLHCEWKTEEELYKGDKRIQAKLKRFKQKLQQSTNIFENVCLICYF